MIERPPVRGTARALTLGTAFSALCLVAAFVLTLANADSLAATLSTLGVIALLVTPAAGLIVTWSELRRPQPSAAIMALVVLGVLGVAVAVALLTRA